MAGFPILIIIVKIIPVPTSLNHSRFIESKWMSGMNWSNTVSLRSDLSEWPWNSE